MYNIHALSGVTEGGVFGVVLLLNHWLHLSPAVSSFVLNAACYALGWRTMGKTFIGYSLIASCGYSVTYGICEQFPPLWPEIASMPLLASIAGALFIGLGLESASGREEPPAETTPVHEPGLSDEKSH